MPAALASLERAWWSVDLPGYRHHPGMATYSPFSHAGLPPIERPLDAELRWLLGEPSVPASLADVDPAATRPATVDNLTEVRDGMPPMPASFVTFIGSSEAQSRVRSCTDCYLDLGDNSVPVRGDGGRLIHFLSDSQWVLHWLLYVGADGSEAVVVTDTPIGFDGGSTPRAFDARSDASVCEESFSEFLYRFWIENEIWFAVLGPEPRRALTDEQRRYGEHYVRP